METPRSSEIGPASEEGDMGLKDILSFAGCVANIAVLRASDKVGDLTRVITDGAADAVARFVTRDIRINNIEDR